MSIKSIYRSFDGTIPFHLTFVPTEATGKNLFGGGSKWFPDIKWYDVIHTPVSKPNEENMNVDSWNIYTKKKVKHPLIY